jgi:hypothetical protein
MAVKTQDNWFNIRYNISLQSKQINMSLHSFYLQYVLFLSFIFFKLKDEYIQQIDK